MHGGVTLTLQNLDDLHADEQIASDAARLRASAS